MSEILVGMSGGIDSTVAAWLLKQQGHNVTGITMSIWKPDRPFHGDPNRDACFAPSEMHDISKTRDLCRKIGIQHIVLDISDEYERTVLKNFREEYLNGHTPNPCVWCNQKIKFGAMVDGARKAGLNFDFFATGHYARIEYRNGRYALMRGKDLSKDQSYFLYRLNQEQLGCTLFPLGNYTKTEIRKIDTELGFHPSDQTESQDFYSGPYSDLLDVQPAEGNIVDEAGRILGRHQGMWNYTIGQRKGLGVSAERPLYVIALNPERNEVVVGYEERTGNTMVTADQVNWVASTPQTGRLSGLDNSSGILSARIRSAGYPAPCSVNVLEDGRICASFERPVKSAACGQSLVIYDGDSVLCGGIIDSAK